MTIGEELYEARREIARLRELLASTKAQYESTGRTW